MTVLEALNSAKVEALKVVKETQWVGETTHDTLDKCLTAINLFSGMNSGSYNPKAVKIKGIMGYFMINQDGGIHFESRIIKISDSNFKIEHLSNSGYLSFESKFSKIMPI